MCIRDSYLHISENKNFRRQALESIEKDALQYRLMHKGYERFCAPCGGSALKKQTSLDGNSPFWDSGYRAMATKLFVERVFLTQL